MPVLPSPARWLPSGLPSVQKILVVRALLDVGLVETPIGSNRSPAIDGYMDKVGSPRGLPWCAAGAAAWADDAGVDRPARWAGAVSTWAEWGEANGLLTGTPEPGWFVLYAFHRAGVPDHMGVVVRTDPLILTVEANTTLKRQTTGSEANGIGCELAAVDKAHVLTYLRARPKVLT